MYSKKESQQGDRVEEYGEYVFSRTVKSVHRTYFLDVRATKGEDLFVSITESRKRQNSDGTTRYDRHKIVLYKEDILRFCKEFGIVEEYLKSNRPNYFEENHCEAAEPSNEEVAEPAELAEEPSEEQTEVELLGAIETIESDLTFEDL